MNLELKHLDEVTREVADFQARRGGMVTVLGAVMSLAMAGYALSPTVRLSLAAYFPWPLAAGGVFFIPLAWVFLGRMLESRLYGGIGKVQAVADPELDRPRQAWAFGFALALLIFQTLVLLKVARGEMAPISRSTGEHPWLWTSAMPVLYLLAVPLVVKGREMARAYAVLVIQACFWTICSFNRQPLSPPWLGKVWELGLIAFQALAMGWALLAIRRGWKEHRGYLGLMSRMSEG